MLQCRCVIENTTQEVVVVRVQSKKSTPTTLDVATFCFALVRVFTTYIPFLLYTPPPSFNHPNPSLDRLRVEATGAALDPQVPSGLSLVEIGLPDGAGGGAVESGWSEL